MFTALKPCTISGKKYIIDDEVDVSKLSDKEIAFLRKRKFIIEAKDGEIITSDAPAMLDVPVINKDETLSVSMTGEQLCEVIGLIQRTADEAIEAIKGITDDGQLVLLHRLDSRKTVQAAAKERHEALTATSNGDDE